MRYVTPYRKFAATASVVAMLLITLIAGYAVMVQPPHPAVEAQGNQPPGTEDLFKPFWEAWTLLHENYVDPLDDRVLMEGALTGMLRAAGNRYEPEEFLLAQNRENVLPEDLFDPYWSAWTRVHEAPVEPLDDNALMEASLVGMMEAVGDPHTDYMDPETWAHVNQAMNGEYEGIGATVRQHEETGGLELVSIMDGSPAEQAGLLPGDVIVEVEGEDVRGLDQNAIVARVRGPAGTLVRLGIMRSGEPEILKFEVKRDRIAIPSVTSEVMEGNIGYIRLSQFEFDTAQVMRQALEDMDANHLNGLILDLRGDPGGYLTTAIDVGSAYLPDGPIVIERSPGQEITHEALGNAVAPDVPMVVLVDQGSASASELIAGALQDRDRATVIGMPTFGKGSVQTWRELSNGGGIRITISRWYTPDGHSVSEVGITPDIEVPYIPEEHGNTDPQLEVALAYLNGTYEPEQATASETVQ